MNRFLKYLVLFLSLFICFLIVNKTYTQKPDINWPGTHLDKLSRNEKKEVLRVLGSMHKSFSLIKSFSSDDISIKMKRASAVGTLNYEGQNLRMTVDSMFGRELDIGSNNLIFWFWSKRVKPQALYYSRHEDALRSRLKPVFNKEWMFECFIPNKIVVNNDCLLFKSDGKLVVKHLKRVSELELACVTTIVDLEKEVVVSKFLSSLDDIVLASVQYSNFDSNKFPRLIIVHWHEEDVVMQWSIKRLEINSFINEAIWELPHYTPKIDMSK